MGKFYDLDAGNARAAVQPCDIKLPAVVTPPNNGPAILYKVPLNSFQVMQSCDASINTVAVALASAPCPRWPSKRLEGGCAANGGW